MDTNLFLDTVVHAQCKVSQIDAGFSFSFFSVLLQVAIIILSCLVVISKCPMKYLSLTIAISAPLLLLFSIISLSSLNSSCMDSLRTPFGRQASRLAFAFHNAILGFLLGVLFLALILLNKFAFGGDWMLGDHGSEKQIPISAPPTTQYIPQNDTSAMAYAPPPGAQPPHVVYAATQAPPAPVVPQVPTHPVQVQPAP